MRLKYCSGQDTFQFLLTLRGLEIYTANSGKKLMTADNQVRQGSHQNIVQNRQDNGNWSDPNMISFTLVPSEEFSAKCNTDKFFIEMTYGERRPRLVTNVKNPSFFSRLLATTRTRDGYRD